MSARPCAERLGFVGVHVVCSRVSPFEFCVFSPWFKANKCVSCFFNSTALYVVNKFLLIPTDFAEFAAPFKLTLHLVIDICRLQTDRLQTNHRELTANGSKS